jgi:hypothetical protein
MRALSILCLILLLAGCATTTSVVLLDPATAYPPTTSVAILLKPPTQPYVEIAKLQSKGLPDEPETAVLEDARERAKQIGAHAIIVQETTSHYQPPVIIDYLWPPQLPWYHDRWFGYRYWFHPPPFAYYPADHVLPGGQVYGVRSIAIRFLGAKETGNGRR